MKLFSLVSFFWLSNLYVIVLLNKSKPVYFDVMIGNCACMSRDRVKHSILVHHPLRLDYVVLFHAFLLHFPLKE